MASPRPALEDRYSLTRRLGQGGFADVWLASDLRDGRDVAVKVFRGSAPGLELDAASRLVHPNIVRLLGSGRADGAPYLVFEYVEGPTLREVLRTRGALPRAEVTDLAAGIAGALDYAHQNGVLHNDVKPENIILAPEGPRLLDFGSARSLRDTLRVADATDIAGTIAYMAPEVLAGEEPTARSDVYAFALVLFEALSGAPPRSAASFGVPAALGTNTASPPRIDAVVYGLPPAFVAAMHRALSPVAAVRPASPVELAVALQGGEATIVLGAPPPVLPAEAPPVPPPAAPSGVPASRPHPARSAVAAGAAALTLVGAVGLLLLAGGGSPGEPSTSATNSTRDPAALVGARTGASPRPAPAISPPQADSGAGDEDDDPPSRGTGNGKAKGKKPKND